MEVRTNPHLKPTGAFSEVQHGNKKEHAYLYVV